MDNEYRQDDVLTMRLKDTKRIRQFFLKTIRNSEKPLAMISLSGNGKCSFQLNNFLTETELQSIYSLVKNAFNRRIREIDSEIKSR